MKVRVACAQIAPRKGDVEHNLGAIADAIETAQAESADIVCFAETALTGYFLEGGVLECSLEASELADRLARRMRGERRVDALIGFYEKHEGQVYNSVAYLEIEPETVQVRFVYRKFFLATYGVFDEDRFVARGRESGVFESRFGRLGILICEDVWHSIMPTLQALAGAQIVFVPSASPGRGFAEPQIGNLARYRRMLHSFAEEHGVFAVNCQLIGFEGGKGLVGGSSMVDPFGKLIAESPVQSEHLLVADLDLDLIEIARQGTPLLADLKSHFGDLKRHMERFEL